MKRPIHYYAGDPDPFAPVTAYCGASVWLKDTTPLRIRATCPECRTALATALAPLTLSLEVTP